jgi:hypothetical protein
MYILNLDHSMLIKQLSCIFKDKLLYLSDDISVQVRGLSEKNKTLLDEHWTNLDLGLVW